MTEQYIVWALIVGIALGAALYWFAFGRLPRRTEDISVAERAAEAAWISQTISERGGYAPADLVDEILELHAEYLVGPALAPDEPTLQPDDLGLPPDEPTTLQPAAPTTPADDAAEGPATRPGGAPPGS
jgi:hypothetical protein